MTVDALPHDKLTGRPRQNKHVAEGSGTQQDGDAPVEEQFLTLVDQDDRRVGDQLRERSDMGQFAAQSGEQVPVSGQVGQSAGKARHFREGKDFPGQIAKAHGQALRQEPRQFRQGQFEDDMRQIIAGLSGDVMGAAARVHQTGRPTIRDNEQLSDQPIKLYGHLLRQKRCQLRQRKFKDDARRCIVSAKRPGVAVPVPVSQKDRSRPRLFPVTPQTGMGNGGMVRPTISAFR